MQNLTIDLIQHLIAELKSGRSTAFAIKSFKAIHPHHIKMLGLENKNSSNDVSQSSLQYELKIIIERGLNSYPILKPLEKLNEKALAKTLLEIEAHTAKAPFLALIPLFLFQMPSLMLIFLYPIINDFLKEMN